MDIMAPLPADDPRLKAWEAYKATPEYANTRRWAVHYDHTEGSLWAAFLAGWARGAEFSYNPATDLCPHGHGPADYCGICDPDDDE